MLPPIILGGSIGLLAGLGGTLNILVMVTLIRGSFLGPHGNVIYPMAFNLLISDTIHLALLLFYLVPASVLQVIRVLINLSNFNIRK